MFSNPFSFNGTGLPFCTAKIILLEIWLVTKASRSPSRTLPIPVFFAGTNSLPSISNVFITRLRNDCSPRSFMYSFMFLYALIESQCDWTLFSFPTNNYHVILAYAHQGQCTAIKYLCGQGCLGFESCLFKEIDVIRTVSPEMVSSAE